MLLQFDCGIECGATNLKTVMIDVYPILGPEVILHDSYLPKDLLNSVE